LFVAFVSFRLRQGWVTIVSFFGMCAMILLGAVESHVLDFDLSVGDIFIFVAIPVGAAWAFATTKSERRLFLWVLYCANWALLAGSNYLLLHHRLQQSNPGPRRFVYSEFYCTWAICVLTPFLFFDKEMWRGNKKWIAQASLIATILVMALTAQISITRSVVLQLGMCLIFVFVGIVKLQKLSIPWLLAAFAGITMACGLFFLSPQFGNSMAFGSSRGQRSLEDRMTTTDLAGEERIAELRRIVMLYGNDLFVGRGLGSGFASVTFSKIGENFTLSPHIAVFTLLMKGGILAFLIGIVLPAMWAAKTIVFTSDPEVYASCAGVLLYIAFSCISGGWTFPQLFGYGFFLSHALSLTERSRNSVRPIPELSKSAKAVDRAAARRLAMPVSDASPNGLLPAYSARRRNWTT
jgi:hypothetical protein